MDESLLLIIALIGAAVGIMSLIKFFQIAKDVETIKKIAMDRYDKDYRKPKKKDE